MSGKIFFGCLALVLLWGCSSESTMPPSPPPYTTGHGFWDRYDTGPQDAYDDEWYFDYFDYDGQYHGPFEEYRYDYYYLDPGPDWYEWEDKGILD